MKYFLEEGREELIPLGNPSLGNEIEFKSGVKTFIWIADHISEKHIEFGDPENNNCISFLKNIREEWSCLFMYTRPKQITIEELTKNLMTGKEIHIMNPFLRSYSDE